MFLKTTHPASTPLFPVRKGMAQRRSGITWPGEEGKELTWERVMNRDLPIYPYLNNILMSVAKNAVTIIEAETGAGKSTQVPQMLLERTGMNMVITQPRRLAARTVAERVAFEVGCQLGTTVGFRTAHERKDSRDTRALFVTDGLAMVRELMGYGRHRLLVIDEVHEWNTNIEVLVAWARLQIEQGAKFKLIIKSATMESDKLSQFFGGAPVIRVPGRTFPVEERSPGVDMIQDVRDLLLSGRNMLVFQPGKPEIQEFTTALQKVISHAVILPLHAELDSEEQAKCFRHYGDKPKCIVATNVAQTSITIDDIDAVVDSGMEKRIECMNGIEGLYLKPISLADSTQRKGRAGRTKPGIYIDHCPERERQRFPVAEILRTRLDQTVLRLAVHGFNAEELEFFHQPDKAEIHEAHRALIALGCMHEDGSVTEIGRKVSELPISVKYGRMIVEAVNRGVVGDVIMAAAIMELKGITARKRKQRPSEPVEPDPKLLWMPLTADEKDSDVLAQMNIMKVIQGKNAKQMREECGLVAKSVFKVRELCRQLEDALARKVPSLDSSGDREQILKSICAGSVDHVYVNKGRDYENGVGPSRMMSDSSVLRSTLPKLVVGVPVDIELPQGGVLSLVTLATAVRLDWLKEIAPELVKEEKRVDPYIEQLWDRVMSIDRVLFNRCVISEMHNADPEHPEAAKLHAKKREDEAWSRFAFGGHRYVEPPRNILEYEVPNYTTRSYGWSEDYTAYGVIMVKSNPFVSTGFFVQWEWVRTQEEAEKMLARSRENLIKIKQENGHMIARLGREEELVRIQREFSQMLRSTDYGGIHGELRARMRTAVEYYRFNVDVAVLEQLLAEWQALKVEVEEAARRRRTEGVTIDDLKALQAKFGSGR